MISRAEVSCQSSEFCEYSEFCCYIQCWYKEVVIVVGLTRRKGKTVRANNKWAKPSEKVPSNMRRFRSSCTCTNHHPGLCSPFIHSVVSNNSVSGQGRLRSDCTDAQADPGLRCTHMHKDTFSQVTAQIILQPF